LRFSWFHEFRSPEAAAAWGRCGSYFVKTAGKTGRPETTTIEDD
jgi:hypothetical protein